MQAIKPYKQPDQLPSNTTLPPVLPDKALIALLMTTSSFVPLQT
jgi:hypothetical protein